MAMAAAGAGEAAAGGAAGAGGGDVLANMFIRVRGDLKPISKDLLEMQRKSMETGKKSAKGLDAINTSLNQIKKVAGLLGLTKVLGLIGDAFNQLVEHSVVAQTVLGAFDSIMGGMIDTFLAPFVTAVTPIIQAFAALIPVVQEASAAFGPMATDVGAQVTQFFKDNKDTINALVTAIVQLAGAGLITFLQSLASMLPQIKPGLDSLLQDWKDSGPAVTELVKALAKFDAAALIGLINLVIAAMDEFIRVTKVAMDDWQKWDDLVHGRKSTLQPGQAGYAGPQSPTDTVLSGAAPYMGGGRTWSPPAQGQPAGPLTPEPLSVGGVINTIGNFFGGLLGSLPHFQAGGFVPRPTLGFLAESGPEWVLKPGDMASKGASSGDEGGGGIHINIQQLTVGNPDAFAARQFVDKIGDELRRKFNLAVNPLR